MQRWSIKMDSRMYIECFICIIFLLFDWKISYNYCVSNSRIETESLCIFILLKSNSPLSRFKVQSSHSISKSLKFLSTLCYKAGENVHSTNFASMFSVLNTMLEDGRNGQPTNFQRRNRKIEFWDTSWLLLCVHAA